MAYVTEEGLKKLRADFDYLIMVERPRITNEIAVARDKGDLSENAEYDAAKEAQGMLEMRISKLQATIRNARVLDESKLVGDSIQILNKVKIRNMANKATIVYTIVPENETDIKAGKISVGTPIAQGLMGKKIGDTVEIQVPAGKLKFEIIEISK